MANRPPAPRDRVKPCDRVRVADGSTGTTAGGTVAGGERRRAVRNVGWSAVQKWFVRLAGVATFVVIGRLLGPEEIGLAALAMAAVGFLAVVADFGMSTFLVQAEAADRRTTSTVFWATLALGVAGAGLIVALAGPLAVALGEPDAAPVLRVLAAGLVLTTLTCVPAALLLREMRFRVMAMRGVAAAVVGAVVGIGLAVTGAGVWALVVQSLVQNAFSLVWFWVAARWRPALVCSPEVLRSIGRFGTTLLGINVVQALRDRSDQVLIGGVAGVEALGYWAVAARVVGLVHDVTMSVMDHVALPLFVRVRDDGARFTRAYETAVAMSTALLAPVLAVLAVVTPVLLPTLFGDRWGPSVLPAQVLCLAYVIGGMGYFNKAALLAFRRPGVAWWLALLTLVLHAAVVVLAAPHGLAAVAWAFSAEVAVVVVVSAVVLRRTVGVGARTYGRGAAALGAAAVALGPMVAADRALPGDGLLAAAVVGVVGLLAYLAVMLVVNRRLLREALADLRGLLPDRTPVSSPTAPPSR